jgi:hypothetical protein
MAIKNTRTEPVEVKKKKINPLYKRVDEVPEN